MLHVLLLSLASQQAAREWTFHLPEKEHVDVRNVLEIPDVNGDGARDVLVGCSFRDADVERNDTFGRGRVLCVCGATARILWRHDGPSLWERPNHCGAVLASLGDVDGDGVCDVGVGIAYWPRGWDEADDWRPSTVRILDGGTGALIREHTGARGRIDGFGVALAGVGDVDGDGRPDYAIGSTTSGVYTHEVQAGDAVVLYSGASGERLGAIAALPNGSAFGSALVDVGDLDDDGEHELAIRTGSALGFEGSWCIASCKDRKVRFVFEPSLGSTGADIVQVGDCTEDGVADLAVLAVAPDEPKTCNVAWVSGSDGKLARRFDLTSNPTFAIQTESQAAAARLFVLRAAHDLAPKLLVVSNRCRQVIDERGDVIVDLAPVDGPARVLAASVSAEDAPSQLYAGFVDSAPWRASSAPKWSIRRIPR